MPVKFSKQLSKRIKKKYEPELIPKIIAEEVFKIFAEQHFKWITEVISKKKYIQENVKHNPIEIVRKNPIKVCQRYSAKGNSTDFHTTIHRKFFESVSKGKAERITRSILPGPVT